jgi:hypothetical protein
MHFFSNSSKAKLFTALLTSCLLVESLSALPLTDSSSSFTNSQTTYLTPTVFGTLSNLYYPINVALQETFGAVANITDLVAGTSEVLLFSTTNLPSGTPVIFGTLAGLSYPSGLALQGTFGAVANIFGEGEGEVLLFSTTDIQGGTPTVFGTLSGLVDPRGVALQGTFGAVANIFGEGEGEVLLFSTTNLFLDPLRLPQFYLPHFQAMLELQLSFSIK